MTEYPMWIAGATVRTDAPRSIKIPFDGSDAGTIFEAGAKEVEAAIAAAQKAAVVMRALTRHERSSILYRAHGLLGQQREEMARAISSESGKPIREARIEVERGL